MEGKKRKDYGKRSKDGNQKLNKKQFCKNSAIRNLSSGMLYI